jgi:hypothetical protein
MRTLPAFPAIILFILTSALASPSPDLLVKRLLQTGRTLADGTHYLEALDQLGEARDMLELSGKTKSRIYGDVLYAIAETKIRGRIHQRFSASYVKSALTDVQACNRLRERLPNILPQQLAQSCYLEGVIHKRYFHRFAEACSLLRKSVSLDPANAAAKRELSELIGKGCEN